MNRSKLGNDIKDTAFHRYMKHMKRSNFIKSEQTDEKNQPSSSLNTEKLNTSSGFTTINQKMNFDEIKETSLKKSSAL